MERYTTFRNSGVELVPSIPSNWQSKPLKFIADCNSRVLSENTDEDVEIKYIDIGSVSYGQGICGTQEFTFANAPSRARRIVKSGDTIISTVRTYLKAIAYISDEYDSNICSTGFAVYSPKNEVDSRFLFYALNADWFVSDVERHSVGISYPAITSTALSSLKAILPPVEEQVKIVIWLDHRTAEIDSQLTDLQSQAKMLERYKRELISETVIKGLDKSALYKNSGVDWMDEIPVAWELFPLYAVAKENKVKNNGMICENLLSLSYGRIIQKDIDSAFGLLPASFEGYQIVQPGYTVMRLTDLQNDKRSLRTGYVTETGIITSAYMGLIPGERLDGKYFNFLLHAYDFLKIYYGLGSGLRQTLNFSDMKRLPVLIPPLTEQKVIVDYIDAKTTQINGLIADINEQIEKLKQYRQIVIHDAVTGKIKVTEG